MPYKEYIDREAALRDWPLCDEPADAYQYIRSYPAADVRPVVYCKDCRHRDPEDGKCDAGAVERAGCVFPVGDNYFCAYGEEI